VNFKQFSRTLARPAAALFRPHEPGSAVPLAVGYIELANPAADIKPIGVRQAYIKDDQVRIMIARKHDAVLPVHLPDDLKVRLFKTINQAVRHGRVIFDQQDVAVTVHPCLIVSCLL
jgi:hypothetical protein